MFSAITNKQNDESTPTTLIEGQQQVALPVPNTLPDVNAVGIPSTSASSAAGFIEVCVK